MLVVFISLFKDTFRRERSSIYQTVLQRVQRTEVANSAENSTCGDGKYSAKIYRC